MNRLAWLALTAGWATTCVLLWFFDHPVYTTFAFLSAAACPRGDHRDPGVGTPILGVTLGVMSSLGLLEAGIVAIAGSIAVTLVAAGWITWSGRDGTRWSVQDLSLSLVLAGAAIAATLHAFSVPAALLSGLDLGTLIYACAPLLLVCAMTAGAARHLSNRHRPLAPYVGVALAFGVVALALVAGNGLGDSEARAAQIHGPNVSRAQFLFGASLLAWLLGMKTAALVGACAGLRKPRSLGGGALSLISGGAIVTALAPSGLGIAVGTALGSVAFATASRVFRVALVILAVGLPWFLRSDQGSAQSILEDRVRTWLGSPSPLSSNPGRPDSESSPSLVVGNAIDGRLIEPPSPPGWPVGNDDLASALSYIARRAGGHNQQLGPETSAWPTPEYLPVASEPGNAPRRDCITLLPGAFALPLSGLISDLDEVSRGNKKAPVRAAILDLRELSLRDLSTVAQALRDGGRPPELAIAGCLAILIGGANPDRSGLQRNTSPDSHPASRPQSAVPLLSAPAVSQLADYWPPKGIGTLLDRDTRWRRSSRRPKLGAHNLRTLLARTDLLPHHDDPDDPEIRHAYSARVRLALCAAILDDDAMEEVRLVRMLSQLGAPDANTLRDSRDEAHEALLQFAIDARNQAPSDADARYRLGGILRGRGSPLAAIDEMTTAIDRLRPLMTECYTELAEAYVDAERQAERRVVKNPKKPLLHILDGVRMVPGLQQAATRHHQGEWPEWLRCRAETSRGEASLMRAQREDETDLDRRDWLMNAAGRFQAALETDPLHAPALRGLAQCLSLLKTGNPGRHAREAVLADPLNPEGQALLARLTPRVQERRQAIATWIWLR